ncbi:MAG: sugar nucleotide-binding protein [Gilvibacter sp.]
MNKILILGASGFIGSALYKELTPYFDVYGTYHTATPDLAQNQVMYSYDVTDDSLLVLLQKVQPNHVVVSLRGHFPDQLKALSELCTYAQKNNTRIYYLSSVNVFDGTSKYASYEEDPLLAQSLYGKFKVAAEKLLHSRLPKQQYAILRLPMVIGVNAPRIRQLKNAAKQRASYEVYPNLIISCTTEDRIARQVHYIVNQELSGIFHLCSKDVIHHSDLFEEIAQKLGLTQIVFKTIYESNENAYLAILPTKGKLPKQFNCKVQQIIQEVTLKEEIVTLKENLDS